jgi:hypothetical protein
MVAPYSARGNRRLFPLKAGLLLFCLCLSLAACDNVTFINAKCIGINVSCPTATPNRPAISATAQAIMKGKPLLSDSLSKQDSNQWETDRNCAFYHGVYQVTNSEQPPTTISCISSRLRYSDVAIQVDVTLLSGDDAGLYFRDDQASGNTYVCEITNQRQADIGSFEDHATVILVPDMFNGGIHGSGKKNTLLVIAQGNDLQFFVNNTFIAETHDSTLTSGEIGFSVANYSESAQARFSNLVIYQV